tara:strand:- start:1376 stop:2362 length:987 start_codon:yes stop_codon:yes gene_type:complete
MCNIWDIYGNSPEKLKNELSLDDIRNFLTLNKDFLSNLGHVGLTGGEPLLLRDDFVDIVKAFREILPWVEVGVQTNGLVPDLARAKLREIVSFYPQFSLAVSIDGVDSTHSDMRGHPSAFDNAIQTIKYAKDLGIERITSGMTVTPYNYKEITQVKKLVEEMGCEFSCFLTEEADYFNNQAILGECILSGAQRKKVAEQLQEITKDHYFMDNLRLLLEGKRKPKILCFSGFTSLVIDPYGNIKPCILKVKGIDDDIFGNIKEGKLESILQSKKAIAIKEKIKKCHCWCQCEVSSSALIFPLDVLKWFIFYCRDKKAFLRNNLKHVFKS